MPTPVKVKKFISMLHNYDPCLRDILGFGFTFGFDIGYRGIPNSKLDVKNLSSSLEYPCVVDESLQKEVKAGRIRGPLDKLPFSIFQINPIGLVPKKTSGTFRMITNLSSPKGTSINDGILDEFAEVSYASITDALELIRQCNTSPFLAKLDIKHAFRLIPLLSSQLNLLCIKWREKYYIDHCLPMGARSSCQIFEKFSSAFHHIVHKAGVNMLVHYLDDYLLVNSSKTGCSHDINIFVGLALELGIPLADDKTVGPTQSIEFLGYLIDTVNAEIRLPRDKLQKCKDLISGMLNRQRCKVKQIQSLAGLLQFTCAVVVPGRAFLVRLYALTCGRSNPHFSVYLSKEVKKDLQLWLTFLKHYNGVSLYKDQLFLSPQVQHIYTDAAQSLGCGGVYGKHWFSVKWPSEWWSDQNITFLELVPIVLAAKIWGNCLTNQCVIFHTDNSALSFCINKKSSKEPLVMALIRQLVLIDLYNNILSKAEHISGQHNCMSDALSRLQIDLFKKLHGVADKLPTNTPPLAQLLL